MGNYYKKSSSTNNIVYNSQIKVDTLRVVDKDRTPLGIMETSEAIELAKSQNLDLVLIVEKADPPVARIIELNKYKYELQKNEKQMAKKARASRIDTKEVKFKPNIGENDLLIKLNHVQEFLDSGCKVKITIQMRGRENSNSSEVFKQFKIAIESHLVNFRYDSNLSLNGNRIIGLLYKDG
jgi:translation initiation factor IF-3|tara:strand:- start:611 stop:1153 length:543 start_codon:yes stop_codon:yes gene_type:complete